jgi:hypothetical protein
MIVVDEKEYLERGSANRKTFILGPTSIPLVHIAESIEFLYPDVIVNVDPKISQNVWFKAHIKNNFTYGSSFFKKLSQEFENGESKQCGRCRRQAWFNSSIQGYQCHRCLAYEENGEFVRIRPRMERARKSEYTGNEDPNSVFNTLRTHKNWTII